MLRVIKSGFVLWLVSLGVIYQAAAFSLLGPFKTWQVGGIGYQLTGDIGGPMSLSEEYRWNTPVITYALDQSFLEYFGVSGAEAVDKAFAILNALPQFSQMSRSLGEFAQTDVLRVNHRAQALGLLDVKSATMELMLEELGLADPIRFNWTLRSRTTQTFGGVTTTNYTVVKLNYDPATLSPSSFVNGSLFGYQIFEPIRPGDYADAIESLLDTVPNANGNPAPVAAKDYRGAGVGEYFISLSRDDIGGLRYIYRHDNLNVESLLPDSQGSLTNVPAQSLLTTLDLTTFIQQAHTNAPADLLALYPNLQITSTNFSFAAEVTTNFVSYLTNAPWLPLGSPPVFVSVPVPTNQIVTNWTYTFGNIVTNHLFTNSFVTFQRIEVYPDPFAPVGSAVVVTNIVNNKKKTNLITGDFYILPPNVISNQLISALITNVTVITNMVGPAFIFTNVSTNAVVGTNNVGTTNATVIYTNNSVIRFATNYVYSVYEFQFQSSSNTVAIRPGIDKLTFVKVDFDSLIGQAFVPITNQYNTTFITNSVEVPQTVRRIISQPDVILVSEDLGVGTQGVPFLLRRTGTDAWINNDALNGNGAQGGPGVIPPQVRLSFTDQLPYFLNSADPFIQNITHQSAIGGAVWGSFDGSTNAPVVYPDFLSLQQLENLILNPVP